MLVRRSLIFRLIAAALFAIVTLAVPGDALAHGMAHHHAHEGDTHERVSAVSAPDDDHEHQHPRLDGATRTRVEGLTLAVMLPSRMPEAPVAGSSHCTPVQRRVLARGDPQTGPTPRLRAPPAR